MARLAPAKGGRPATSNAAAGDWPKETEMKPNTWDVAYEWKAVALLALGFGLVGLDRWLIAPLFPSSVPAT